MPLKSKVLGLFLDLLILFSDNPSCRIVRKMLSIKKFYGDFSGQRFLRIKGGVKF
jgi:hypothetical protein